MVNASAAPATCFPRLFVVYTMETRRFFAAGVELLVTDLLSAVNLQIIWKLTNLLFSCYTNFYLISAALLCCIHHSTDLSVLRYRVPVV
jgi:hypothetical protein